MASSGVWENVHISKTPTFDGVCGKLSFITILNVCQIFLFVLLTDGKSTLYIVYDRCYCHIILTTDVIGRCYCHVVWWLMPL